MTRPKSRFLDKEERKERILRTMKARGLTMFSLSKRAGVDFSSMKRSLDCNMRVDRLCAIANVLRVSTGFLLERRERKDGKRGA